MDHTDHTLATVSLFTEEQAREYLEAIRWPEGPVCPHCGSKRATRLQGKSTRPGTLKCKDCRRKFTVMVGSIFEDSHIPLRKWVIAFHLMCSSKKGISAKQLERNLGLSYESAWFMAHRVRHAMASGVFTPPLSGTVEVDETYVGGKPRPGSKEVRKPGRGTKKTPVVALVERGEGGRIRAKPIERVDAKTLKGAIRECVDRASRIMTDEWSAYTGLDKEFAGGHDTVNHGAGEYARDDVHTNTAESYFALLKRGVYGTFHHVSKKHLHRYCDEFSFRWGLRRSTDGERTAAAVALAEGKRLTYS